MPPVDTFRAIADPSRRQILQLLAQEPQTINALAENFDMSRPAVSKHVKMLHTAGFIAIEDAGRERYCSLKQEGFDQLHEWMDYFDNFWKTRLSNLEQLLNNRKKKIRL